MQCAAGRRDGVVEAAGAGPARCITGRQQVDDALRHGGAGVAEALHTMSPLASRGTYLENQAQQLKLVARHVSPPERQIRLKPDFLVNLGSNGIRARQWK